VRVFFASLVRFHRSNRIGPWRAVSLEFTLKRLDDPLSKQEVDSKAFEVPGRRMVVARSAIHPVWDRGGVATAIPSTVAVEQPLSNCASRIQRGRVCQNNSIALPKAF